MAFMIFIFCLGAVGFFHRREHELFVRGLRQLQPMLAAEPLDAARLSVELPKYDWRLIGLKGRSLEMRRAFQLVDREAALRYAVPTGIACVMLVFLHSFIVAGLYIAALGIKWFTTVTVLNLDPLLPEYEVRLGRSRLFGEGLTRA